VRTHSEYEFTCECGEVIVTREPATKCAKCGRLIKIVWREEETQHAER
jgi:hypothetical protein